MKTATRVLFTWWVMAMLAITAGLIISAHYQGVSDQCAARGGNHVNGVCQIEAP